MEGSLMAPWTAEQQKTARAIAHGWKPKGKAKGFTRKFAEQVIAVAESKRKKGA